MIEQPMGMIVYPNGTKVLIGEDIPGTTTGALLRGVGGGTRVLYEVSWFNGRSHECKWLEEWEVRFADAPSKVIGFGIGATQ